MKGLTKVRVLKVVFDELLNTVKNRFENHLHTKGAKLPSGKGAEYFGFKPSKDGEILPTSLTEVLLKAEGNNRLKAYVKDKNLAKLSPKHIYNLSREFSDITANESILVEKRVLDLMALYLDFPGGFMEFLASWHGIIWESKILQLRVLHLKEGELANSYLVDHFIGFYYSYSSRKRMSVRLKVNFFNNSVKGYPCQLFGVHDDDEGYPDLTYNGYYQDRKKCSFVNMSERESNRPLTMTGFRYETESKDLNFIRFAATAVSQKGFPISFEVLFVRLDSLQRSESNEEVIKSFHQMPFVDFYLQAQRRNFRIPPRLIRSMNEIRARKNKANSVQFVIGTYRILVFLPKKGLYQHRYKVEKDFTSMLFVRVSNPNYREQPCMISLSETGGKLCISAHVNSGISVINYAILDIDLTGRKEILSGTYCGIDPDANGFNQGAIIALKDEDYFETGKINQSDLEQMLKNFPGLKEEMKHVFLQDETEEQTKLKNILLN